MIKNIFTEFFFFRLLINLGCMIILVRFIYFRVYGKKDLFSPFFLLNFIVFLLAYMLKVTGGLDSLGGSIGLVAAFSLMRFRTETITMKDMTYLFIVMAVALLNSIMAARYWEIIALNSLIIVAVIAADGNWLFKDEKVKVIEMEGMENIKPDQHAQLIETLRNRTGLNIRKVTIESVDFVKMKTTVKIYYF